MQFWFGMAVGLLIGWIGEWLLTRRGNDRRQATADPVLYSELHRARQELERLKSGSETADPLVATDTTDVAPSSQPVEDQIAGVGDDLTVVKGIGPVFAGRLNAAGIISYADLAQASPKTLEAAVATNQKIAAQDWIAQAKALL